MKISIVGSISFLKEFKKTKNILEKKGHKVFIPGKYPGREPISISFKREAMEKFNENLKKSDAVLVMNYTKSGKKNYIGVNSLMEIGMAFILKKKIFLLNPFPEKSKHEFKAIDVVVLNGDLNLII